jgi:wobble nucleotide-excising tRNase
LPEPSESIDAIVRGLRVKYTPDLDLGSYLDLLDGKTTRAIREITKKIMEDPYAAKYSEHLNSKIVEFNREIEQVGKSRTAKFYHAVSDIAVYGGSKFVERQTESYVKSNKKELHKVSEWIASKFMDFHAKVTGKDWTIAQLYRTRCKIGECRKPTEANKNT